MGKRKEKMTWDLWIGTCALCLLAIGLLMVASASMVISDRQFGYAFHYFNRQAMNLIFGLVLAWVVTRIPLTIWKRYSGILFLLALFLSVMVLMPGIGKVVNGSRRWINLEFVSLQVSEVLKFCSILYLANYLERFQVQVRQELKGFMKPMILAGIMSVLLLLEPDFGAAVVITMTYLMLLFIAGVRIWPFIALAILVAVLLGLLAVLSPYRMQRLTSFLNPWSNQFGSGYQLTQSLIAFGRGGLLGVGLGNSVQKLFYLPEAHTDFLFAVIAEELGLMGVVAILALFAVLIGRIFIVALQAGRKKDLFSYYLSLGLGFWIALQTIINIGVNTGLMPTKGLTLPFISYGGSSMLMNCVLIGLMLRVSYETGSSGVKIVAPRTSTRWV